MKRFKAALFTVVAASAFGIRPAAATEYNTLCIDRADGVCEHLKLDPKLDISVGADGSIVLAHPAITVEYAAEEVERFRFDAVNSPDIYDGDHESAIETVEAPSRSITITPDAVSATGVDAIEVYDIGGRLAGRAAAENGTATFDASRLPGGVYILRAGTTSLKIKL